MGVQLSKFKEACMHSKTRRVGASTRRSTGEGTAANYALARHLNVEMYECDLSRVEGGAEMTELLQRAAKLSGAGFAETGSGSKDRQVVSGVLAFGESHFAVHAWPEHGYAAVDLFTSNPALDLDAAVEVSQGRPGGGQCDGFG